MSDQPLHLLTPDALAQHMLSLGLRRVSLVTRADGSAMDASHEALQPLADLVFGDGRDYAAHEGVFLEIGRDTDALFGAFVHDTRRGQGSGGLRYWPYKTVEGFLRDGLRLSRGMTRKNALAGIWWGGGKGIIARQADDRYRSPGYRAAIYTDYAEFVTSLRGCYVTAEDAGTGPADMSIIHAFTRFATCIPPEVGGSGNPSPATAHGVVCAMEAAADFLWQKPLAGLTVAMQGTGNVGSAMIDELLARDVKTIVATDIDEERAAALRDRFAAKPVEIRLVAPGDNAILAEPCDILAPNALGGILGPDSIGTIQAKVVCGAANNQLLDEARDAAALRERGITYVPDYVANRMGIVSCANEQYGQVPNDEAIARHFGREWENSVFKIVRQVLQTAKDAGITTAEAANRLADELAAVPHPIWGHRGRAIIDGLAADNWAANTSTEH